MTFTIVIMGDSILLWALVIVVAHSIWSVWCSTNVTIKQVYNKRSCTKAIIPISNNQMGLFHTRLAETCKL
jgi:hypothetical protein